MITTLLILIVCFLPGNIHSQRSFKSDSWFCIQFVVHGEISRNKTNKKKKITLFIHCGYCTKTISYFVPFIFEGIAGTFHPEQWKNRHALRTKRLRSVGSVGRSVCPISGISSVGVKFELYFWLQVYTAHLMDCRFHCFSRPSPDIYSF